MNNIPSQVSDAFPALQKMQHVRQLAAPIPLVPDTTFDIFADDQGFFALVTTDHADPHNQSRELKDISGEHKFEFAHLIKPFDNKRIVQVILHDKIDENFFVLIENEGHRLYYYLAKIS